MFSWQVFGQFVVHNLYRVALFFEVLRDQVIFPQSPDIVPQGQFIEIVVCRHFLIEA